MKLNIWVSNLAEERRKQIQYEVKSFVEGLISRHGYEGNDEDEFDFDFEREPKDDDA